jgi:acylphosphatase
MTRVTSRLVVTGRVQGVSFRASMQERASLLGVDGWVRNSEDGSVEAIVQGEEEVVALMVGWARVGPRGALVSSVVQERLDPYPRQTGFRIVP